jgi:hypothetical protein
LIEGLDARLVA